jgi:predicted PurR-regulated permease PerM
MFVARACSTIATFGFNGLVIGPAIAAMFIAAWDIFSAARQVAHNERACQCMPSGPM